MTTWEYKAYNLKKVVGPMLEGKLNELGREGWELVAQVHDYALLKRPLAQ